MIGVVEFTRAKKAIKAIFTCKAPDRRGRICPQCGWRLARRLSERSFCPHCDWEQNDPIYPLPLPEEGLHRDED